VLADLCYNSAGWLPIFRSSRSALTTDLIKLPPFVTILPKIRTHFITLQRVERWANLVAGYTSRWFICPCSSAYSNFVYQD